MPRPITSASSLDTLKKEAKRWLSALRAADPGARARLERACPGAPAAPMLRDVQHALAREHGLENWLALKQALAAHGRAATTEPPLLPLDDYTALARAFVQAYDARDAAALARLGAHYGRELTVEDVASIIWGRVYAFRERRSRVAKNYLREDEARTIVAQDAGFGSWDALADAIVTGTAPVPAFVIESRERRARPRRYMRSSDWERLLTSMREEGVTSLQAEGMMTDAVLAGVAALDHVTSLALGGSRHVTDDGLQHLARMPQLEYLEMPSGRITDRGLEVLQHLPNLRHLEMAWNGGVTDAGMTHLRRCDRIESINLIGTSTGDGAIAALAGKRHLRRLHTGRLVTDAGAARLADLPQFAARTDAAGADGAHLMLDGPFTNAALTSLAKLEGIVDLDFFWHVTAVTSAGFAALTSMPNLMMLAADGALADDEAMRHFARVPRLRELRAQEAVATDAGFEALSASTTLAGFWGRVCPNFGNRGFLALARMPALERLGIGCAHVDDEALAAFPDFPALRDLTPIGVQDAGFRHIGRCERLDRLTCMYCRDTTDEATAHVAGLRIRYYYAGLTRITDRSLQLLGGMHTLEQVELYECTGVTDAGLPYLARLPDLREVALAGLPGVTLTGTRVFPASVRVRYTT